MFDPSLEQPIVYKTLSNMIKKGRIPHALIFNGDKSTKREEMVRHFIKMVYADYFNEEVSDSGVYKRIDDDSCLNVLYIKRDTKTSISIDSVRDFIKDANISSLEEGPRFYVFLEADYLNQSSSNAILKFVEEPTLNTYIIFVVENLNNLLDTIISRCVTLNFRPIQKDALKNRLLKKGYDSNILDILIEYTQSEEKIESIINDQSMMDILNLVTDMFREKFEFDGSIILYLNEHYSLLNDSDKQDFFLSLTCLYLMDVLNYISNKENKFIFNEETSRIKRISLMYPKDDLVSYIKELIEIKTNINNKKSINLHLYLDNLFLKMEMKIRG